MTSTINAAGLERLAAQQGPCLTLLVPDHHLGAADGSQKVGLRTLTKSARERIAGIPAAAWPPGFETPLEELALTLPDKGGPGLAVYRTPDSLASFPLPGDTPKAVLASHPYLMPLLAPAFAAHHLFVLGLSTKHLRLLEYVDGQCKDIPIPASIPANLAAATHSHHGSGPGEGNTPSGHGVGKMGGIRFGTSGDRESARDAVDHFCALIDQGLRPLLKGRPLLLMGVKEEIAAFRRVSHCDSLMHTEVDGNVESFTPSHIAGLAGKAALAEYQRLGKQVLADLHELRDRTRAIYGAREVLQAAAAGRVHQLCVRSGTEMVGPMEASLNRANLPSEDLVNAAVVETLRNGGEVYLLPADQMPVTESACAILRY
jgi:hypothetical protein